MDYNFLSPYVRYAVNHTLYFPFEVCERIIFDYEIILPQGGVCRFEYDGKVYMCKKGDVIFIRPGHEHRLLGVENSDFIQPHVHFDMITDAFSAKRYICFEKYENIPEEERYLLGKDVVDIDIPPVFTPENGEYLSVQLYELIEIFSAKGEFWQLLCKEKMLHILYIIFSQFDSNKKEESNKIEMLNIKSYIDGNYSQRITLDYLAERFLMNKFYIEVN